MENCAVKFSPPPDAIFLETHTLARLFETQVRRTPEAVAVLFPDDAPQDFFANHLCYGELNENANRLAHFLQELGVGPGALVGICAERSLEMIFAVLGVIKSGAAYVPLDPAYPEERLRFMIEDTNAKIILTQQKLLDRIPAKNVRLICLDRNWDQIAQELPTNPAAKTSKENLAYVIYTSGSTGRPKGVAMRQGALANLLCWQLENWSFREPARTLQFASLNFDVSFQEIFSTWCSGGTLVLINESQRRDSMALVEFLRTQKIQRLFLPFVALKHLAEAAEFLKVVPTSLKEIITAGEQLKITPAIANFFRALGDCTLENQYGPSETHVVTAHRLTGAPETWAALPPIGRAISNTEIRVLDEQLQPVPSGEPGELFLGGDCLARGYLNRPELTAEKFIPNPFNKNSHARLYKTGDLVRVQPDGNLEFLGRIDHQIKVNGFRVELGEIEATLHQHPAVRETIVTAREAASGNKQLVAYFVPQPGQNPPGDELRNFLQQKLPAYLVPSIFVRLDALPLNSNGKVDRLALPEMGEVQEDFSTPTKAPLTPLQLQLQLVFERLLNRRPIGIDVSFFELGGDSLQALNLIIEVERVTQKKLSLAILYRSATVEGLAKIIEEQDGPETWSAMAPLQPLGSRPPLFLVHTTPGDVLGYGGLVFHLGTDQPCYGFQSLAFHQAEQAHTRIEQMAAYYIRLLRGSQPRGPYFLGGWCYGGIVAVEMAHQLLAAGQEVAFLALIETPAPAPPLTHWNFYLRRIGCLLKMKPRAWQTYLRTKIKYYSSVRATNEMRFRRAEKIDSVPADAIEERNRYLDRLEFVYQTNVEALKFYKSRTFPGRVVLFNAAEQDPALIRDPQYGWVGLAGEIETHVIPANHDTILMDPQVRVLAQKLGDCLRRAQQK